MKNRNRLATERLVNSWFTSKSDAPQTPFTDVLDMALALVEYEPPQDKAGTGLNDWLASNGERIVRDVWKGRT